MTKIAIVKLITIINAFVTFIVSEYLRQYCKFCCKMMLPVIMNIKIIVIIAIPNNHVNDKKKDNEGD